MDELMLLYREQREDGRTVESTVVAVPDGIEIATAVTSPDGGRRRWGRVYTTDEAAQIVAILGGGPDDLDDPAAFLHRQAAAGELPTDQTLDSWLADHGIAGATTD